MRSDLAEHWKTQENSENWNFEMNFLMFSSILGETIILVKSSLHKVRLTQGQIDGR